MWSGYTQLPTTQHNIKERRGTKHHLVDFHVKVTTNKNLFLNVNKGKVLDLKKRK